MLRSLAILYLIMIVLSALLVSKRTISSRNYNLAINDENDSSIVEEEPSRKAPPLKHLTFTEVLMHPTFWYISCMLLFSMTFSSFMKPQMKNFGQDFFNNDMFLSLISVLAYFSSTFAKFAWGAVHDACGFVPLYILTLLTQISLCLVVPILPKLETVYAVWILLVYVCEASHFVLFPAECAKLYGSEMGSIIYSMMYFARALAAGVGIIASSAILPKYDWSGCFLFFAGMTSISLLIVIIYRC